MDLTFIRYRGCLLDPRKDGCYWFSTRFDSVEKAKVEIDRCYDIFQNSNINNVNQKKDSYQSSGA